MRLETIYFPFDSWRDFHHYKSTGLERINTSNKNKDRLPEILAYVEDYCKRTGARIRDVATVSNQAAFIFIMIWLELDD